MRRSIIKDRRIAVSAGITVAAIAVIGSTAFVVDTSHTGPEAGAAPEVQPLAEAVTPPAETSTEAEPVAEPPAVDLSALPPGPLGVPGVAQAAYQDAAKRLGEESPSCNLDWTLLAGIGQVETNHGYGRFDAHGNTAEPIYGPRLDGVIPGTATITDTDRGEIDGDTEFDRAVGPVQFIPETWRKLGLDANGDGKGDPNNIFDSAYSTAHYLCASGGNMQDPSAREAAILSYNNNHAYVANVNAWATGYATGVAPRPEDLPEIHPPVPPTPEHCPAGTEGTPEGPEAVENEGTPEEKVVVPGCKPLPEPPSAAPAPAPEPAPVPTPGPDQGPGAGAAPAPAPAPAQAPQDVARPAGPQPAPGLPIEIPGLPPLG